MQVWERKKIIRKPKQKEQLLNHVWLLTKQGYRQTDIAKFIKRTPVTVYTLQNTLVQKGRLERDENGHLKVYRPKIDPTVFKTMDKIDFKQLPCIAKWIEKKSQVNHGTGLKKLDTYVGQVLVTCNTLQMHPDRIIYSYDENGDSTHLDALSDFMMKFAAAMREGSVKYLRPNSKRTRMNGSKTGIIDYVRAWSSLLESHGKPIPANYGGKNHILSRTNQSKSGLYSGIQLSDEEFAFGMSFAKAWGNDLQALYALQHEMITRTASIFEWPVNYEIKEIEIKGIQCRYAEVKNFYESKTRSHWTKLVADPNVLKILEGLNKGTAVVPRKLISEKKAKYNAMLRKFYQVIDRLPKDTTDFAQGTEAWYLYNDPSYVLRHSGAHNWLRRCGYRYDIVSQMGWESVDVLAKYYAKQSFDYMFRQNECYFCNPPNNLDTKNQYFCSLPHVLAYKNSK